MVLFDFLSILLYLPERDTNSDGTALTTTYSTNSSRNVVKINVACLGFSSNSQSPFLVRIPIPQCCCNFIWIRVPRNFLVHDLSIAQVKTIQWSMHNAQSGEICPAPGVDEDPEPGAPRHVATGRGARS